MEDDKIEKTFTSYENYIDSIFQKLPFVLKMLARSLNLHDGKLKNVCLLKQTKNLTLGGIFGDLEIGYYLLEIRYLNVINLDIDAIESIFRSKNIQILSDELELLPKDIISHRMLFSTKQHIDIQFTEIEILIRQATSTEYKEASCEFKII